MLLTTTISLWAQTPIVITEPDMPYVPCNFHPVAASTTGVTIPTGGTNKAWDYSGLVGTNVYTYTYSPVTNTSFPTADVCDSSYSANIIPGRSYLYTVFFADDADGFKGQGLAIDEQRYNIGGVTGGATDSAIFPKLTTVYPTPYKILSYPLTMSTSWRSNYVDYVNFNLTIANYGLDKVPSVKKTYYTRFDTVVGWGTIKVPLTAGSTAPISVLMVKRSVVGTDSFFMNGTLAPGTLLSAFGLSQGQQTINNRYSFWRKYAVYPMAVFNFGSSNFTTLSTIYFDGDASNTGIVDEVTHISLYPNPVSNMLKIEGLSHQNIMITDISGKVVYTAQNLTGSQNVNVAGLHQGIYIVNINGESGNMVKKINVIK